MERIHNEDEFKVIYSNVRKAYKALNHKIPAWNIKQNNVRDKKSNIIYKIDNFEELTNMPEYINSDQTQKDYYIRRWFNHKWALCDEYLFCVNENCEPNPIYNDKKYDININSLLLDVKGTVIPKRELSSKGFDYFINNPEVLVKWYYDQQSTDGRYGLQNRLFIVHFSSTGNHDRSRFAFEHKRRIYNKFCKNIDSVIKYKYTKGDKSCLGLLVYVIENEKGVEGYIPGVGWYKSYEE